LPDCGAPEIDRAVAAARRAFEAGVWTQQPMRARAATLETFADRIAAAAEELALLDSLEMGMPIAEALDDVAYSAEMVRTVARLATMATSGVGTTATGALQFNMLEPHGVVAAITPWNFPLNQALVKLAPALAMGNSVVLKPSEIASLSALRLGELAAEAGLPGDVLQIVTGRGQSAGAALAAHPGIDHLTFTGSTRTGALIQAQAAAASGLPRSMAMELGGKSPQIVCESFDDVAGIAPVLARGIFWNAGQVCSAGSRLLVHRSRAEALLPQTAMGPIASRAQHQGVLTHLERAEQEGAACVTGGRAALPDHGLWVPPTILAGVTPGMGIASDEVFGPVLAVSTFDTREEAAALANASGYGLVAGVWTADLNEGHYLARALRAGAVTVNGHAGALADEAPALGIEPFGRSGFGADYGLPGLKQYARLKLVSFNSR
jgi:acyl-CoA reductase-like NAD-dependent aldehyde dehydrogenase